MTDGAIRGFGFIRELSAVNIFMAPRAGGRRLTEDHQAKTGRERAGAVALVARRGAVRAGENKTRRVVVEFGDIAPGLVAVACLAAAGSPFCLELPLMRIDVAPRAGEVREAVGGAGQYCRLAAGR